LNHRSLFAAIVVAIALSAGGLLVVAHSQLGSSWAGTASRGVNTPPAISEQSVPQSIKYEGPGNQASAGPAEQTTSITLLPAGKSIPISSVSNGTNVFAITYVANGTQQVTYVGNATLSLSTDAGTNVTVSGSSRFLLDNKMPNTEWVLDSEGNQATFVSGSSVTLYYYEVLGEPAYYSVIGRGSPPSPTLTYLSAPSAPSSTGLPNTYSVTLTTIPNGIWSLVGTEASVNNPASGNSSVRWATQTSSWTLTAPLQISEPVDYYLQYYLSIGYSVNGGGTGYSAPVVSCPSFGGTMSIDAGTAAWVDAGREDAQSSCDYSPTLPGSSQSLRWYVQSESVLITGPGTISQTYQLQYPLTISYNIVGATPPSPPTITSTFSGLVSTVSLPSNMSIVWIDSGSAYSLSNPLPLSNSSERWSTTSEGSGNLGQAASLSLTFYQQFLLSVSYSVVGGGAPQAPSFSYISFGGPASSTLTAAVQDFWADGGSTYSASSPLPGSNSTDRWYSPSASGVTNHSVNLTLVYHHQFLLSISGGGLSSQWFDINEMANITIPGVFARGAGIGQKVVSYSLDGQSPVRVTPSTQNLSITVPMQDPHQLTISSVKQFQLTLDRGSLAALVSITSPTISGDRFWYDGGENVTVVLNGVWGRGSGTGFRLASYSVNGGMPTPVETTGTVTVLSVQSISSPEILTSLTVPQYYLTISTGSLVGLTPPAITGDSGWYDQGTLVNATFNNSWDIIPNQSRLNAVGFAMNGGAETPLSRSGSGTFVLPLPISQPLNISVDYVTQYHFGLTGDSAAEFSAPSPTGDDFFDAGTGLRITTANTWGLVNGTVRQRIVSYDLDGEVTNVTLTSSGTTTTPTITFDSPHQLSFTSMTQDLVNFRFTDFTGAVAISPRAFGITLNGAEENLSTSRSWFDSGTQLNVTKITWEGIEMQPVGSPGTVVTKPQTLFVRADVYQASLKVTDLLGLPVSGVEVSFTFVNQTSTTIATGGDGVVSLGILPAGTYRASASGLAGSTNVSVDPASSPTAVVNVIFSYAVIGIILVIALLISVAIAVIFIRRSRRSH
jgi:hypothetical protein